MPTTLVAPRRGSARSWAARAVALLFCLLAACSALLAGAPRAEAHPLSTTAILLDVGAGRATGQVQLPLDRLAIALDQPLTAPAAAQPATLEELRTYVSDHLSAGDPATGKPWTVAVTDPRIGAVDGVDHLLVDVALTAPGAAADLTIRDDGIVHRLLSHRILISSRPAGTDDAYTTVGILDWQTQTLAVPRQGPSAQQGFLAAVALGVRHIGEGADHLLFLLMLLLPAPLVARRGRWVSADGPGGQVLRGQVFRGQVLRRQVRRVVHVVTAFALGHSVTLALAGLGYVSVATRVVESLIAVSVLVSGVHALRPVVRGGEVWIAAGFGLMHGLAFAALLGPLDLSRSSLVVELLGFNVGIELTQLIVVALIMPSLLVLSRSRVYPVVRAALAALGIVLAAGWLAERTTLIATDPLDAVSRLLVDQPLLLPGALALAAATLVRPLRRRSVTAVVPRDPARN